jgi:DNA-binding MarR family transcriptional regulator
MSGKSLRLALVRRQRNCSGHRRVSAINCLLASNYLEKLVPTQTATTLVAPAVTLRVLIARLSRRLRQTQAGAGLTPTQLSVLATVVRHGHLGLADLSKAEGINPTMLSRIVAKLSTQGLLTRRADPLDGRAALVSPTERGRRLQRRIQAERNDVLGQRLDALPRAQRQLLVAAIPALEALADSLLGSDQ